MMMKPINISEVIGSGYNQFWHTKCFYRVVKGSRGSKKSKTTALDCILKLVRYPWSNILVLRRYSNTNRQSTYTDLKWAINRLGLTALFSYNESLPELKYKPTGQKIIFRGLDDELKITSISVDTGILCWAWFEEAYQIEDENKFDTVVESIRGSYDDPEFYKQITVTFNPWNENHWLKRKFFDPKTRVKDLFADTTTYRCNEWLDDKDKQHYEDLYRTNPRRARIVCDGDWGVAEGLVFDGLFEQRNFSYEEIANLPKAVGLDFGFKHDPTAGEFMAIDQKNRIVYIYDEFYHQGLLTQQIAQALAQHKAIGLPIVADSAEQRLITELAQVFHVPNIRPAGKGKNSIVQGIQYMQSYKYVIHPKVKGLFEEFNTYAYAKDKNGNWLNTPEDAHNHGVDALRYAMELFMFTRGGQYMSYQEREKVVRNLGF